MWCGVLGPLVVRGAAAEPLTISGPARRLLFAALVSRAGRTVSPDTLIEDLWGHVPPRTAAKTLQSHVVRLRADLGRDPALVTDRAGYRLELQPTDVDAHCFEVGVRDAAERAATGDSAGALARFDAALNLWRGDAYEEFADAPCCVAERVRLTELRAHAEEERTEAALRLGRADDLIADLEKRVAAAPYRERTWEQLVLALYRAGRQADALGAYRRARSTLGEDLGVDPGPRLQRLEGRILHQDPTLLADPDTSRPKAAVRSRPDVCPYRGLASYREGDEELFVGRERLTAELVGMLAEHRVIAVVGASGTGKSSLLRAGLVPALRAGALPGSAAWRLSVLTPADASDAVRLGDADVVVLDQAEDLFVQLAADTRSDLVARLARFSDSGGRLVFALRADYYGRLPEVQPLAAYAQAATVLVGPLREDELRRVVVDPAERVGLQIESALIEAVLDDVTGQPAALPLLSAALVRTWENRGGALLTLDGYRRGGGVASALEATAEDAYVWLPEPQRAVARRLLVRLATREGQSWARRPMRRVDAVADEDSRAVIDVFSGARLITVGQERVEITHDALLAHWPRLRDWLDERVLAADLLDHLAVATRAWSEAGRPDTDLYRGARLRAALDWRTEHPDDIAPAEGAFLDAAEAAADAELSAARRQVVQEVRGRRRLRLVAAGLAVMVVLAAVGLGIALHERGVANRSASRARAAALAADARRLAALSANAPDIATSSLLAVAAYRLQDSADTRGALLSSVERNQSALWRTAAPHRLQTLVTNPAGTRVAVIDNRRMIYVYDPRTRRAVSRFASRGDLISGMTADGNEVVVIGPDQSKPNDVNRIAVLDAATGRRLRVLGTDADLADYNAVMSQDSHWLAVLTTRHLRGGVVVDIFDASNWAAPARHVVVAANPVGLAVARGALTVQAADGAVTVWSLPGVQVLGRFGVAHRPPSQSPVAVAPGGRAVALADGGDPTRITVYSPDGTKSVPLPAQPQGISRAAFSPDGSELAVGSFSGSLNVYRTDTGAQVEALAGQSGPLLGLAWSGTSTPTGLYSDGLDSQLVSWSVTSGPRLVRETGPDLHAPDRGQLFGQTIMGQYPQGGPGPLEHGYAADLRTGRILTWPLGLPPGGVLDQAVASRDGRLALLSIEYPDASNRIVVWDLLHDRKLGQLAMPSDAPRRFTFGFDAAISPDGRTAYCNLGASRIGVFDLPSGRYRGSFTIRFADPDGARVVAFPWQFDPAGDLVVGGYDTGPHPDDVPPGGLGPNDTSPENQRLGLVDVRTGRLLAQTGLGEVSSANALAWSPDHRLLAIGTFDGTLGLYDARTLHLIASAGAAEPGVVKTVSFSPSGRDLVTGGTGGALRFFSVPDLDAEGSPVYIGNGANNGGVFGWYLPSGRIVGLAPDEQRAGTDYQRWYTFRAAPRDLVRTACALAGTDITRGQWQRYVGDQPYRHVCS